MFPCKVIFCYLSVLSFISLKEAARILAVFPTPSLSHQVVFRPITQELARRGHKVTVITPDPAFPKGKAPENVSEIDLHDVSYKFWKDNFLSYVEGYADRSFKVMSIAFKALAEIFEINLNNKEVQAILKAEHFDLILAEACVRPTLVMAYVFKAPIIQISSLGPIPPNLQVMGASSHPLLLPEFMSQRINNLTTWEKISESFENFRFRYMVWTIEQLENEIIRRYFGPTVPTIAELQKNVDMLFLNINPIWEGNRPVPPGVIYMGGLHQKSQKELPSDLKSYLDSSQHGVIYMSFGTNVIPSQLSQDRIQIFIKVFSKLPYDVLWKWDKDNIPGKPKNVRLFKFLPQSDLLRHSKIKVFITQAGLQSTDESITAGVPLIAFPMLGDQWYNAEKYLYHKIGIKLDFELINEDMLENAIKTVIADKSYRHNIEKLRRVMLDQPQSPLERAIWWIEYVLRHGGAKHLRSPLAHFSWTEYLMLDVIVTLIAIIICLLTAISIAIKKISKYLKSSTKVIKIQ